MQLTQDFITRYSSGAQGCEMDAEAAKNLAQEIQRLRIALADCTRRPMGVIPKSADGLLTTSELDQAEARRAAKKD